MYGPNDSAGRHMIQMMMIQLAILSLRCSPSEQITWHIISSLFGGGDRVANNLVHLLLCRHLILIGRSHGVAINSPIVVVVILSNDTDDANWQTPTQEETEEWEEEDIFWATQPIALQQL